jgi:hypothetical protein
VFWCEPQGLTGLRIHDADQKWSTIQKRATWLLSRLRAIKYRSELETAFVRYVRALDSRDHSDSFAAVWSVLEYVTDSVGEYDRLIRRVATRSMALPAMVSAVTNPAYSTCPITSTIAHVLKSAASLMSSVLSLGYES